MKDILCRLTESREWLVRDGFITSARNASDAADEIKQLRAENARQAERIAELQSEVAVQSYWGPRWEHAQATIERQRKVIEQAKTALTQTREELRACQAVIHLCGGFDPRYVSDAQAAMRVADDTIAAINALPADKPFQSRVNEFVIACFGEDHANNIAERNHRFLEEAIELVQSTGCTQDEAHQLVDYVFGRPVGEPYQEVGGVMVTLAALCSANGLSMVRDGETELARVWTVIEKIRAKQAAKPRLSPLPGARVEA